MSSVQSAYAQRNNNVQTLTPTGTNGGVNDWIDINVNPLYTTTINVDVRNVTPYSGKLYFNIVYDQTLAALYPGLEFTVFFDSYNLAGLNNVKVAMKTPNQGDGIECHYPFETNLVEVLSVSIKSNGRIFNVIGGGVAYWE
jgi:hypothetical protein